MNIGILITQPFDPNAGGVQRTSSKLYDIFESYGHKCLIISLSNKETKQYKRTVNYITVHQLREELISYEIDVLINQAGYSIKLNKYIHANIIPNIKVINTLRVNPLNFFKNHKFIVSNILQNKKLGILDNKITHKIALLYHIHKQRRELGYIIENSDAFVMLSEKFKQELYYLVPSVKIYNDKIYGISNPFKRPELDIKNIKKEKAILYVGRLDINQKRVDILIKIWKELHYKLPDYKFWVVGDGPQKKMMIDYCEKHKLFNVDFFGKQQPDEFYRKAKIFNLTSAFEGFGNVLVEAQSYGCIPVLFDTYPAASEIVNHNVDGILIEAFDIDLYAKSVLELTHDENKINAHRINAYENSLRFSYEKCYSKWVNVFNDMFVK